MLSDQQTSWWVWRSPTIRQQTVSSNYTFFIQVSKYHPDHYRIFDAGNDLDITGAFAASINIDVKHAFQALCPSHCSMTLGRGLILFVICCLGFSAFAPFRGGHHCTIAAASPGLGRYVPRGSVHTFSPRVLSPGSVGISVS